MIRTRFPFFLPADEFPRVSRRRAGGKARQLGIGNALYMIEGLAVVAKAAAQDDRCIGATDGRFRRLSGTFNLLIRHSFIPP